VSEIREPRKSTRIWLGTYPTPEMAAAALALRGGEAALNFPGAAASRPAPASCSSDDIRAAAAAAAAMAGRRPGDGECVASHSYLPQAAAAASTSGSEAANNASASEQRAGERCIVDEDDVFQMPRLLEGMAEGLMMSPPALGPAAAAASMEADEEGVSLWDHS